MSDCVRLCFMLVIVKRVGRFFVFRELIIFEFKISNWIGNRVDVIVF